MKITTNATTLREIVVANQFNDERINAEIIGTENFKELQNGYKMALESLTVWAAKDYAHISKKTDKDRAFTLVKDLLSIYTTDDSRIIIDECSLRTLRDLAISKRREYSQEYKVARKLLKKAVDTIAERCNDIGIEVPDYAEEDFDIDEYIDSVGTHIVKGTDITELLRAALSTYVIRTDKIKTLRETTNWTWVRPAPVSVSVFGTLVENYVADCITENYNIKSYTEDAKARKEQNKAIKEEVEANA